MLRSLTPASLQLSRLRCSILVTVRVEPVLSSRFAPPRSPLPAMSTAIQPTAHNNRNKRTADKQHSGKWKKRQVWRDNNEGSRSREDRQSADGQQQASTDTSGNGSVVGGDAVEKRLPKRKVAVVFGYNGGGYSGLQIQSGSDKRTIEADVADAILAAGGMIAANREQLSKVNWQRCARTDKGVHAATNLLSLNIITEPDGLLQYSCTSRVYHYILPAYAFDPAINQHITTEIARERGSREEVRRQKLDDALDEQRGSTQPPAASTNSPVGGGQRRKGGGGDSDSERSEAEDETAEDEFDSDRDAIVISAELRAQLLAYRIPDELYSRVRSLLARYVGTHNYYNFTRHKLIRNREDKPSNQRTNTDDPAAQPVKPIGPTIPVNRNFHADRNNRHILSFTIDRTFVDPASQLQFLVLAVHGQSFMLNQIRKMVGLAVVAARGMVGEWVWERVFSERGMYVPTAPSLGLYLERPNFAHYDVKCRGKEREGKEQQGPADREGEDSERPAVQQVYDEHEAEIAHFRQSVIYPSICSTEVEQFAFYRWLAGLGLHPALSHANERPVVPTVSAEGSSEKPALATSSSSEETDISIEQQAR